jgi:hypothetical protein
MQIVQGCGNAAAAREQREREKKERERKKEEKHRACKTKVGRVKKKQ